MLYHIYLFDAGKKLAESIVKEKLAACVNRVPGMCFGSLNNTLKIAFVYFFSVKWKTNM